MNDNNLTDGEKRLSILKEALREYTRQYLHEIADAVYNKGYNMLDAPCLSSIIFQGRDVSAEIDYAAGEITFFSPGARDGVALSPIKTEEDKVEDLKNLLFYKPILDMITEKANGLPDYFDAGAEILDALGEKALLPADIADDRTVVDKVELSQSDIETIARILEEMDFPGILDEYSANVMTKYVEQGLGRTPGT